MGAETYLKQMAGFLLVRAGGRLPVLRLILMMYLADRESMRRWGDTISRDRFVSTPDGPMQHHLLDWMVSHVEGRGPGEWHDWIGLSHDGEAVLLQTVDTQALEWLSDSDVEALEAVWTDYGGLDEATLHGCIAALCPEWDEATAGIAPLPYRQVFQAMGHDERAAIQMEAFIEEHLRIDAVFTMLRDPCGGDRPETE